MEFERLYSILGEKKDDVKNLKVLVLGLGGVGGYTVETLARCGIKKLVLVDYDTVDITNINRQIIAFHSTVGKKKIDVFKERIKDISKDIEVELLDKKITKENIDLLFNYDVDFIVDACDYMETKKELIKECLNRGQKFISSMGTALKLDPTKLEITDLSKTEYDPIAKVLRKYVKDEKLKGKIPVISSKEKPLKKELELGSVSFVPSVAGILITSYIVREVIK